MFGRRPSSDNDAVAAARRRLSALAAQFEREGPLRAAAPEPREPDAGMRPVEERLPLATPLVASAPPAAPAERGRHLARRAAAYGRWGLTAHHVTIAALAMVAVMVVATWWVLRSVPDAPVQLSSDRVLPDPAPSGPTNAGTSSVSTPTGGVSASQQEAEQPLVVDVAGKVRRSGIVELPSGSRVIDALDAAGGARPGVDTTGLNLARLLVDGEQIVVGLDVPAMSSPTAMSSPSAPDDPGGEIAPVNLNTATMEQLDTLPGIGPVTAEAILAWRVDNGAFSNVAELLEVSGIGDATLADLEPYVYV